MKTQSFAWGRTIFNSSALGLWSLQSSTFRRNSLNNGRDSSIVAKREKNCRTVGIKLYCRVFFCLPSWEKWGPSIPLTVHLLCPNIAFIFKFMQDFDWDGFRWGQSNVYTTTSHPKLPGDTYLMEIKDPLCVYLRQKNTKCDSGFIMWRLIMRKPF